jgi:branched-chain amino acid transport system permease protein
LKSLSEAIRARRVNGSAVTFLAGFLAIVLLGKGVNGYLINGMTQYVPNGMYLQGLVLGALNGLLAMGLVLIYRANRIINFAQGALGAFAATLAGFLVQIEGWPFYLAVLAGLIAAIVSSALVEMLIIRRFAKAPRLILTVATIAVAQLLSAGELIMAALASDKNIAKPFKTPLSWKFEFGKVFFTGDHIMVLLVTPVVIGGLIWFMQARATASLPAPLRRTPTGRASSV